MTVKNRLQNLYLFIIISLTYTAANYWPIFSTAGIFILIGCLLPFFLNVNYFTSKIFPPLLLYLIIVLINVVNNDAKFSSYMALLYEVENLMIPSSMLFCIMESNNHKTQRRIVFVFLLILLLTAIATTILSQTYTSIIRSSFIYYDNYGESFYEGIYRWGCANYTFTHAIPCLIPVLFCAYKGTNHNSYKLLFVSAIAACILLAYLSGSFACLLMSLIAVLASLIIHPGSIKNNIAAFIILFLIFVVLLNDQVLLSIVDYLEQYVDESSDFNHKLDDIRESITRGEQQGDFAARNELYGKSYNTFADSIIIGSDDDTLGGHSAILDRLGSLGLVGFMPFFIFLYACVKYTNAFIQFDRKIYYYLSLIISFSLLFSKALDGWSIWLVNLVIVPSVLIVNFDDEGPAYE